MRSNAVVKPKHPTWKTPRLLSSWLVVMATLVLGGCATLSESECAHSNWFAIGAQDGRAGYSPDRLDQHAKACAKHGYGVDTRAYDAGYLDGLKSFCMPARGFALGRDGTTYQNQCPREAERDFLPAYYLGKDIRAMDEEIERIDRELTDLRAEIDDEETSKDARKVARQRLRYLTDDRARRDRDRNRLLEQAYRSGFRNAW